ncbi:NAD(P)H-binding protein [Aliivibrio kagoshimensis]|uniref:NAD(P)H-binding protein n=1 Tax=Aliivibrio kagoshimensis TaxID=2910230 RepID=UPI003D123271
MPQTISVLGSGWLGFPLIKRLIAMNQYTLKASCRSLDKYHQLAALEVDAFQFDIEEDQALDDRFFSSETLIVNIPSRGLDGYKALVDKISASNIKRVILVSTTSVYLDDKEIVTESDDVDTSSVRYQIEQTFEKQSAFDTLTLRFAGLIGPNRHPGRFFKPGRVVANAQAPVNMLHLDDGIGIILAALNKPSLSGVLNCCSDTHPTKHHFYSQACAQLGATPPEFHQADGVKGKIVCNTKVKQQLDYCFSHPDLMQITF